MTGFSRTQSGLLTRSVISEEDMMELTDGGWYKTPRIIKGEDFLEEQKYLLDHIKAMHID